MYVSVKFLQDFYEDLFEELNKYGEIESLNVCGNFSDHMVIGFLDISKVLSHCFFCER